MKRTPNQDCKSAELVDTKELAQILKVTTRTIYNLIRRGMIPRVKVGKRNRFQSDRVIEALTEREQ